MKSAAEGAVAVSLLQRYRFDRFTFDREGSEDGLRRPPPREAQERLDVESLSGYHCVSGREISTRHRECAEMKSADGRGGRRRLASDQANGAVTIGATSSCTS
jgi:hypothetical protein